MHPPPIGTIDLRLSGKKTLSENQIQKLKDLAEYKAKTCACGKPRFYAVGGQQLEHQHIREGPVYLQGDIFEPGPWQYYDPAEVPEYTKPTYGPFDIKLSSLHPFKGAVETFKALTQEVSLVVSKAGLTARFIDPSHVALIDFCMAQEDFMKFEVDKPVKVALRVEDLLKYLGRGTVKDMVRLAITDENAADTMTLDIIDGRLKHYEPNLIESSAIEAPLPRLDFDAEFTILADAFQEMLKDIAVVSDQFTVQASSKKVDFSSKSDIGKASEGFEKDDAELLSLEVRSESRATYDIGHLDDFLKKAVKISDTFEASFFSHGPIRIRFRLSDGPALSYLDFYLAPRVNDDGWLPHQGPPLPEPEPIGRDFVPENPAEPSQGPSSGSESGNSQSGGRQARAFFGGPGLDIRCVPVRTGMSAVRPSGSLMSKSDLVHPRPPKWDPNVPSQKCYLCSPQGVEIIGDMGRHVKLAHQKKAPSGHGTTGTAGHTEGRVLPW